MKSKDYSSVSIPMPLYEKVKGAIEDTGFRSVSEYTIFLLRESLSAWSESGTIVSKKSSLNNKRFTRGSKKGKIAENTIKQKLEMLGYI